MGTDLYVGPLCRYFARDWLTRTAQGAQDINARFATIGPSGVVQRQDPREFHQAMKGWRILITPDLRRAGVARVEWDERVNAQYFTAQLPVNVHSCLLLHAAYLAAPDLHAPDSLPERLDQDAAWVSADAEGPAHKYAHLRCELWLPLDFESPIVVEHPSGRRRPLGSSFALARELALLNQFSWKLPRDPASVQALADQSAPLVRGAIQAWDIFTTLASDSVRHTLPMVLDY